MDFIFIDPRDDFDFFLDFKDNSGNSFDLPESVEIYVRLFTVNREFAYIAFKDKDGCKNCSVVDGRLHVVCQDHHPFLPGRLKADIKMTVPDPSFASGIRTYHSIRELDLIIAPNSDPVDFIIEESVMLPCIYTSAYEMARKAGYEGTLEEYTEACNNLPEAVAAAKGVSSVMADVYQGKKDLVKALQAFLPEVSDDDSYRSLADAIMRLPVKPDDFEVDYADTLLGFLRANERKDYPYMWGVEFLPSLEEKTISLSGADAYLVSDGSFYEGNASHTFADENASSRFVIFYYKAKEYTVFAPFTYNVRIIPFNGEPSYLFPDNKVAMSVDSYVQEPYDLGPGRSLDIRNNTMQEIRLRGLRANADKGTINPAGSRIMEMPDLEVLNIDLTTQNNSGYALAKYPALKSLVNGTILSHANITAAALISKKLSLPSLKSISGGVIAAQSLYLQEIDVPELETMTGGTIINQCNVVTEVSLPSLKTFKSGGAFISNCQVLAKLISPSLESIEGTNQFFTNCPAIAEVELKDGCEALIYGFISGQSDEKVTVKGLAVITGGRFFQSCSKLTEADLPDFRYVKEGNLFDNCQLLQNVSLPKFERQDRGSVFLSCAALKEVSLPEFKVLNGGSVFNQCHALQSVDLPSFAEITEAKLFDSCNGIRELTLPKLSKVRNYTNGCALAYNCQNLSVLRLPELEEASNWSNSSALVVFTGNSWKNDLTIELPALRDTRAIMDNGANCDQLFPISGSSSTLSGHQCRIRLGAPQDGYIRLSEAWSTNVVTEISVEPGFRSYLNLWNFNSLTKESLEALIDNLGDNSEHDTLQIVIGTANLNKISDETKLIATNKNYTLS